MKSYRAIAAAVIGLGLTLSAATPALAHDRDHDACRDRIQRAEQNLRNAERKHGEHSKAANKRREQLENARRSCHADRDHDGDRH